MRKLGGVVTHMQQSLTDEQLLKLSSVSYMIGSTDSINDMLNVSVKEPFSEDVVLFLSELSKKIMADKAAKAFPDVITLGFWLRKSSVMSLKERYCNNDEEVRVGRGITFHIAPSNVAVNYAYSLFSSLIMGNANIVRIPSKDFPQVSIINRLILSTLENHREIEKYICLVRYGRDKLINDIFSSIADVRVVWGGDATIAELRQSPMKPRATEITFADRYSLAVIDSDVFLAESNQINLIEGFYNDTFLSDQNACTSPRVVVWTGNQITKAKDRFWSMLHEMAEKKYEFQSIMGVNKLTSSYLAAVFLPCVKIVRGEDNLIIRLAVDTLDEKIMDLRDNSGYFFEYDCKDILELKTICNDTRIQTIGYIGNNELLKKLAKSGIKGIDRIVPVGKTMDFDMIWDGYDLSERLSRRIFTN